MATSGTYVISLKKKKAGSNEINNVNLKNNNEEKVDHHVTNQMSTNTKLVRQQRDQSCKFGAQYVVRKSRTYSHFLRSFTLYLKGEISLLQIGVKCSARWHTLQQ